MSALIDPQRIIEGIKYGVIGEVILGVVAVILWWLSAGTLQTFPIGFFCFGSGGLLLIVAGCIGPGRYTKDYKLLLFTPDHGSSFSNEFQVSGFTVDPEIKKAEIIINGQAAGILDFSSQTSNRATINRSDFISSTINTIFLRKEDVVSNSSDFTLFEYTDEMSEEEVAELYAMETKLPDKTLEQAEMDYNKLISRHVGSIAIGIGILAVVNFLFVSILGSVL